MQSNECCLRSGKQTWQRTFCLESCMYWWSELPGRQETGRPVLWFPNLTVSCVTLALWPHYASTFLDKNVAYYNTNETSGCYESHYLIYTHIW